MSDPIQEFMAAMLAAGLTPPDTIEADGQRHRFDADGRKGKKTGWYTLYLDGLPAGNFGCWRTLPEGMNWCSKSRDTMTEAERQAHRQRMADMQGQREQETKDRQAEAKAECAKLWEVSKPCPDGGHAYLTRKGIKPYGLHIMGKDDAARLLVPMRVSGELVSLQFIGADGTKRFKTGGQVQGAYCAIGKPQDQTPTVIVCEGYATGASLHQCSGHAVAVAFNAGNLKAVAQALRQRLPEAKIIMAADDDVNTEGNPGLTKAREAAQEVGGLLAVPDFGKDRPDGATDFNDLHQMAGSAAVLRCIDAAVPVPSSPVNAGADRWMPREDAPEWLEPEPLPVNLPSVPAFSYDLLPEALRGWVADIAERMQCPPDFLAVGAVVALSSLVGPKVVIHPKAQDDWAVVPNLWGMLIAPPGAMKSPALAEVLKPIFRLEANEREAHSEARDDWQAVKMAQELQQKVREKDAAKKAGKVDTATLAAMLKAQDGEPEPVQRRLIVNDCSVEALTELLRVNEWGLLAYRDELAGLLESMTREGQEGARSFYLSAWNGDSSHTVDRIGRGLGMVIPRVCLSLLGGIQPGKLQSIVRGATDGGAGDDGLLQRFQLAVWPDSVPGWRNVDRWPDSAHRQLAVEVFDRLHVLPLPAGDAPAWRFSPDALAVFVEWRTEFEMRIRGEDLHPAMVSHLAKYRKLVPALALLFALVDTPQDSAEGQAGQVQETELLRSLAWSEYLERHADRIYAAATMPETGAALALLRRIRQGDAGEEFTTRDVARKGWGQLKNAEEVRKACQLLADYQWLRRDVRKAGTKGGRASEVWMVNPSARDADLKTVEGEA